ncbi:MAG TPA: hypothetical protein VHE30_13695 [Polyangiaceae bacterium]|nr:hypothetical protein [Polyangiaceae bacterium]
MTRALAAAVFSLLLVACGSDPKSPTSGPLSGSGGASNGGGASGGGASGSGGELMLGTGGEAPACKNTGEKCESSTECCEGNTCNNTAGSAELNGCRLRCTQSSDCQSGCCVPFQNDPSKGICADAKWCACGTDGSACSSQLPPCCTGHVCLATDQAQTAYACRKECTANTDCTTNCCVAIPGLGGKSACLGSEYCPAAP